MQQFLTQYEQYRLRPTFIIGQTQTGKSNLTNLLIQQDINDNRGILHIDLDGTDTHTILSLIPERRIKDVILIDFADTDFPVPVNPLEGTGTDYDATIAEHQVDAFKSIWGYGDTTTPDMDRIIFNAATAAIDLPSGTILDMYGMLASETMRTSIAPTIRDAIVRNFWEKHFANLSAKDQQAMTKSSVNKLERFVSDARIRNALGQNRTRFDFRKAIESRKIILISIPQNLYGLGKAKAVGGLLLAQFFGIAQRRKGFLPFHVYLPDCHHLAGQTLKQMLSTIGKKSVSITLSCQYLDQLRDLKSTVFGNVGNWFIFRVGLVDAVTLEELFDWNNTKRFLYELSQYECRTLLPNTAPEELKIPKLLSEQKNYSKDIVKSSRHFYAQPRWFIENSINEKLEGIK